MENESSKNDLIENNNTSKNEIELDDGEKKTENETNEKEKSSEKKSNKKLSKRSKSSANKKETKKKKPVKPEWCRYFAFLNEEKREKLMELPDINNHNNKQKHKKVKSKYNNISSKTSSANGSVKSSKTNSITNETSSMNSYDKSKSQRDRLKSAPLNKQRNRSSSSDNTSLFSSNESLNKKKHPTKSSSTPKKTKNKNIKKILNTDNSESEHDSKAKNKSEDDEKEIDDDKIDLNRLKLIQSKIRNKFDGSKNFSYSNDYATQNIKNYFQRRQDIERSLSTLIKLDVDSSVEFNRIKEDISRYQPTVNFERATSALHDRPAYKNLVRSMASNLNSYNRLRTNQSRYMSHFFNNDDDNDLAINYLVHQNLTNNQKLKTIVKSPYGGYLTSSDW